MSDHVDVLIIGAGLSGIGAAAHLAKDLPGTTYAVLERRAVSGGTWDLFRYPGVRSDSDMHTLGYRFRPWVGDTALADGASILDYVRETAREFGVDRQIRYGHHVTGAAWDSGTARWTVTAEVDGEARTTTADFLWACSGYYDYDEGHSPHFEGQERFDGRLVHPQHWPDDLDHAGKRVVVIGSGATAVTLVPAMVASGAAHVTMLQRSPTYILPVPGRDAVKRRLTSVVGEKRSYAVTRWKNIGLQSALYRLSRTRPAVVRRMVRKANVALLPPGYPVDTHFNPTYDPWDQRMCLVPDGDLFHAIREGRAEVVTDRIRTFTETGVELESGTRLDADIVVTATGLNLKIFGGAELVVDGEVVKPHEAMAYRAMMLSGVPNFAFTIGYTNASWTLKADLVAEYVVRLLAHRRAAGKRSVVPVRDASVAEAPLMDFDAGYVRRAVHTLPHQGDVEPWSLRQNYLYDARTLRRAKLDDGVLRWS
ncbi:Predicted flavoprotein CzcO associated with the cation diffusion facilitator CzcD [Nocardioides alpinus]|uniref:NAD(P)/FAD-dependent oxidoreductase n=1 Tax=Nocardioides alpinus TaxID=748909 RepID=A0A1I0WLY8_9ACTN|nr:NAD(P)/FAD-dependent oxidoreductase [Nocardioides alpinus]PKH37984.1 NAD(P)/FAD-dependent oxidoreductase [Nocardioides alpinus]SFA89208.1 Predicted flavoprotein CzcO associated with the cation diffusion facilitator CzcD [Nocardioides alpinus]